VEAGGGFADLQCLRRIIGDARIVSLGEATHGTREFFQLKHRLLEFLVTELDFAIFGIEANYPECLRINDYVRTAQEIRPRPWRAHAFGPGIPRRCSR
jgi:erythromycin esterase